MASTSALPKNPVLHRSAASGMASANDSESSAAVSPVDSPRPSASSTSLSSLSSIDADAKNEYAGLLDTYGNAFTPPDFTIKDIRDAIPKHCFERSALKGYAYILRDIVCLASTFYLFHNFVTPELVPSTPLRFVLWGIYTALQGLFGTGLWVIAHECGHGAFSSSTLVNDFTGWVIHSSLLVPYFSWKFSHSAHHKATGHMERDMVFLPRTREQQATRVGRMVHELGELCEETPVYTMLHLFAQQLIGWPNYLLTNVTGHNFHERQREGRGKGKKNGYGGGVNHFDPNSPIFDNKHAKYIVLSDIGLAIALSALTYLGNRFGWANMAVWYFIPYLWVNHWLVAITFLQHTDPTLPHYTAEEWNYVRGAAATIDREMGFIGRHLLHGIIETHVLHHYVSSIPFYNADEASDAIKPIMGKHYRSDTRDGPRGFIRALWQSARWCQWVEPSADAQGSGKGVLFFRNSNGLGTKPISMKAL
ncbi:delta12 fatty acid desaturase [Metarhizium rileyi]|uniref:Delta12 fatty acid desaturase n=1 Tax=Metarhizium rileyi (strain RCEF 4871) TaxID=1649241 RepID=A0A166W9V6_METRR|nr:delta12 fatty acid desaturase [Metarhizium rileyi RCEF 4871]